MNQKKLQGLYRTRKAVRYALYAVLAVTIFAVAGFFVFPPLVKSVAIEQASKVLHRPVSIQKIRINPFAMTLDVEGLSIKEREGTEIFASFDSLRVNLESASVFKRGVVVGDIRLVNPYARVVRLDDHRYNFSDLMSESTDQPKNDQPVPMFSLNNIQLLGGALVFEDQPVAIKHEIRDINIALPFISNMAYALDSHVEPSFSAAVNGAPLNFKGKSKPFADSLESELDIDLTDLKLAQYFAYMPVKLPVRLESGTLDTALKLSFRQDKDRGASLQVSGTASVRNLDVKESSGEALLALKRLDLALGSADLLGRNFVVDRIVLDSPDVNVHVDRQGGLNWAGLQPSSAPVDKKEPQKTDALTPTPPVIWSLDELSVVGGVVNLVDESRKQAFKGRIEAFDLRVKKLESRGVDPAEIATRFRFNRKGEISLDGTVNPFSFAADLNLAVKTLELLPLHPYFADNLNASLTKGQLTTNGVLRLRKPVSGAGSVDAQFSGQATVGDFQAVDKVNSADFLRWKSLYFGKVDVNLNPLSLSVGEIALSDFFARIIVSQEGKLNLLQLVRQDESTGGVKNTASSTDAKIASTEEKTSVPIASRTEENKPVPPIRIGKITLQGGDVRFTDNFVKPNYSANLKKIGGRISGLSSEPGAVADLELRGSYDNVAPLSITAKINPLSAKPYLDLQAEIKGVEMTSFSSYSGKYAGYAIEKGKLSLFVNYKIENDQLQAENRVFLDQLTFGNPVDSPDATKLPVTLAVSLLKNRNGEIDLNLPISGSLNDPQFSVGGLVIKVIVNLVVKAVTSPFALLGSLFGGEEMSMIEFDYGRSAITPVAEKRLDNLAKALIDRPGLKLEITGFADTENDPEGLKRARIERKVKALKRENLSKKEGEGDSDEAVSVVSAEEYPVLLERVYRAEKFPKPRNMVGMVKTLPVDEMEKLMLANSTVDEENLRDLAERRAKAVRDWLTEHQVPLERVFLLPAKMAEANTTSESDKKASNSRASFSLK